MIYPFPTKQQYLKIMLSYGNFREICKGKTNVLIMCLIQFFLISRSHKKFNFLGLLSCKIQTSFFSKLNWTQGKEENLPVKIRRIWNNIRDDLLNTLWHLISWYICCLTKTALHCKAMATQSDNFPGVTLYCHKFIVINYSILGAAY